MIRSRPMTPEGALHMRARRLTRTPAFIRLSAAAAEAIAHDALEPLAVAIAETDASVETTLFASRVHGVSAWLAALSDAAPGRLSGPLHAALADERARVGARQRGLQTDLMRLAIAADAHGLPFVPLKGSVLAIRDPATNAGRPTADIDLLAEEGELDRWVTLLASLGYRRGGRSLKHDIFYKPSPAVLTGYAEHPDNPRPVEVHRRLREHVLGRTVDVTTRYRADLRGEQFAGVPVQLPGATGLALHMWLHTAGSVSRRGARLLQFIDLAHLDHDAMTGRALAESLDELAWAIWTLAERVLPGKLSRALEASLAAVAPPSLRRQRAWRARPGMLGVAETDAAAIASQLRLCRSPREAIRHLVSLSPERAQIETLYGAVVPWSHAAALVRYVADRLLPWRGRDEDAPSVIKRS